MHAVVFRLPNGLFPQTFDNLIARENVLMEAETYTRITAQKRQPFFRRDKVGQAGQRDKRVTIGINYSVYCGYPLLVLSRRCPGLGQMRSGDVAAWSRLGQCKPFIVSFN